MVLMLNTYVRVKRMSKIILSNDLLPDLKNKIDLCFVPIMHGCVLWLPFTFYLKYKVENIEHLQGNTKLTYHSFLRSKLK